MKAVAIGSALVGLEAREITITADVELCDPSEVRLEILGLRSESGIVDAAARETRVRLRSALGFDYHRARVVVEGFPRGASSAAFDLPIAVAILRGMGRDDLGPDDFVFVGELALDGRVRGVRGALCHVGSSPTVVPEANAWEAGLAPAAEVYSVAKLTDVADPKPVPPSALAPHTPHGREDLSPALQRVLDDARDRRRVLLVGPPGSGRTMIARVLASSSEPLSPQEGREIARIYGAAGLIDGGNPLTTKRPLRAPHHSVSTLGLVGGGEHPRPGEVTLAHRGVLFLDELPEFRRSSIEALAAALNAREQVIARSDRRVRFPAEPAFVLASADPCPCGYYGHPRRSCRCTTSARERWEQRLASLCELLGLHRIEVSS